VFDLDLLSSELGIPVVTAVSVRKGGTADLLRHLDGLAPEPADFSAKQLRPLSVTALRALQREADRIIAATVTPPARPDTATTRIDSVVLHPVAGLLILLTVLFGDVPGGIQLGAACDGSALEQFHRARTICS